MGHLAKHLGRNRRQTQRHQYDGTTKAQLWEQLKAAERRCERAAQLANDLGRVLRQETSVRFAELSDRAYKIRDVARGDYPERAVE